LNNKELDKLIIILNSTLTNLLVEATSQQLTGSVATSALMVYEVKQFKVLNPILIKVNDKIFHTFLTRPILSIFEELGFQKCAQRNCKPSRASL
jgi:hypothetical protein